MSHELKRRLIGATVLISLAIIFLPMILEHEPLMVDRGDMQPIPAPPDEKFKSSLIRDEVVEERPRPASDQSAAVASEVAVDQPAPAPKTEPAAAPATTEAVAESKPLPVEQKPEPIKQDPEPVKQDPAPVEKPVPKPAPGKPGLSAWVIQVGSFSNPDNARKLVQRLRAAGLDTMEPQPAVVNGKQLYRVKVGPELDKPNAEKLLPKVKEVAGLQGTVIRYP